MKDGTLFLRVLDFLHGRIEIDKKYVPRMSKLLIKIQDQVPGAPILENVYFLFAPRGRIYDQSNFFTRTYMCTAA